MNQAGLRSTYVLKMSNRDFTRLSEFINAQCGIKMPLSKKPMLAARLLKRLRVLGLESFTGYCDYVLSPRGMNHELVQMIDVVTTNKTDFFREPKHFDYLLQTAVPNLVETKRIRRLRVWSAGCSTGEEAYTLAMVLSEFAQRQPGFGFSVLATDISARVLETARRGVYSEEAVTPIPPTLKKKYFLKSKDSRRMFRVVPELRATVEFRRGNLMDKDFEVGERLHVIFCRNVIIYFERSTQEALLKRLYRCLDPGGYIFMGHSETLNGLGVPLIQVHPTVYRKAT